MHGHGMRLLGSAVLVPPPMKHGPLSTLQAQTTIRRLSTDYQFHSKLNVGNNSNILKNLGKKRRVLGTVWKELYGGKKEWIRYTNQIIIIFIYLA